MNTPYVLRVGFQAMVRYRERNQAAEAAFFLFFGRKTRDSTRLR
jgi:hypothetical protein